MSHTPALMYHQIFLLFLLSNANQKQYQEAETFHLNTIKQTCLHFLFKKKRPLWGLSCSDDAKPYHLVVLPVWASLTWYSGQEPRIWKQGALWGEIHPVWASLHSRRNLLNILWIQDHNMKYFGARNWLKITFTMVQPFCPVTASDRCNGVFLVGF